MAPVLFRKDVTTVICKILILFSRAYYTSHHQYFFNLFDTFPNYEKIYILCDHYSVDIESTFTGLNRAYAGGQ